MVSRQLHPILLLAIAATMVGCGAGPKPVQTVTPVRATPPQPARDASGTILTVPVTVTEGLEFTTQTLEFLTSETATVGEAVRLEVDNNVVVNGAIVVAAGAPVRGTIASVSKAGRMGKSGNISIRVESAETVDGQRLRLRATKAQGSDDATGSTIALSLIVSPLFLFRKGNDVAYQPGTRVTVYADEKLDVKAWRR